MTQSLPTTSMQGSFTATFAEVSHTNTLGLVNDEQLRLFHLAVQNNQFNYTDLTEYLVDNIINYVFSRAELAEYEKNGKLGRACWDALLRLSQSNEAQGLGEILLYIFLEQVLKAPKVLSSIELQRATGQVRSKCDAMHLLTPPGAQPISSIVFGTSTVVGDMQDAVDEAFEEILQIKNNQREECRLAEQTVFSKTMDFSAADTIRKLLIPEPNGAPCYDTSFGIFLGYNLGLNPNNYPNRSYRDQLTQKLALDISAHAKYIAQKIRDLGLARYSFYIYVIPFDDCLRDSRDIMNTILHPGGLSHV